MVLGFGCVKCCDKVAGSEKTTGSGRRESWRSNLRLGALLLSTARQIDIIHSGVFQLLCMYIGSYTTINSGNSIDDDDESLECLFEMPTDQCIAQQDLQAGSDTLHLFAERYAGVSHAPIVPALFRSLDIQCPNGAPFNMPLS